MRETEEKLLADEDCKKQPVIVLGYWDHEKTPTLIKDLETSIDVIEIKCKKLLQDLLYYKKYLEELSGSDFQNGLPIFKANQKENSKKNQFSSGSVPDITVRKNLIDFQELEEVFKEKFQEKLLTINNELALATGKIGLMNSIILFPTENYLKTINTADLDQIDKTWSKAREGFIKRIYTKNTTKSDTRINNVFQESEFSKITKNELHLYQKLSRLSLSKKLPGKRRERKTISYPFGRRNAVKFRLRKTVKETTFKNYRKTESEESPKNEDKSYRSVVASENKKVRYPKLNKNKDSKSFKVRKNKSIQLGSEADKTYESPYPRFHSTTSNKKSNEASHDKQMENNDSIETICKALADAIKKRNEFKPGDSESLRGTKGSSGLRTVKKVIPFTSCSSTSKSFNIAMKTQQCLPTIKKSNNIPVSRKTSQSVAALYDKKDPDNAHSDMDTKTNGFKSDDNCNLSKPNVVNSKYIVTTYPWSPRETNSSQFEKQELEEVRQKDDVWITKQCISSNVRKSRSKYTGTVPESFVQYHKSTTRQYTNGQESMIKSKSKIAYAVGSKMIVSNSQRTDLYEIGNQNFSKNAAGDGSFSESSKLKSKWTSIYNALLTLYRKYAALKEQVKSNESIPSEADLKSLENEIDQAIDKYKKFLKLYSNFLYLRHQLKSIKFACFSKTVEPDSLLSPCSLKKLNPEKPTSTQMKKTYRQVQVLQDQIRLINDF